jgi:hypothetical protein
MLGDLGEEKFVNLDEWVPRTVLPSYKKQVLDKLLRRGKPEEAKQAPLAAGRGMGLPQPRPQPYIIGDPYI